VQVKKMLEWWTKNFASCQLGDERVTYLHRTQPDAPAIEILNFIQIEVLKAGTSKQVPSNLTVAWTVESIAALGGYLEHRRKTPIGIQVLWRGWLKLHDLCQGWQLARAT
jgi:hypothetical protein